jgi:PAS domain S-box-containing protein
MNETCNVILIEDNPDDAELIELQLSKTDLNIDLYRIQTTTQLKEALKDGQFELVISDYNLGQFTAEDTLSIVRAHSPDMPFILVSGYIDVKKAIRILVAGADDFVMKDELDHLIPVVQREVQQYRKELSLRRERDEALYELSERVKEQKCLHLISRVDEQGLTIDELLEKVVNILPSGWQYPEITEAKIEYNGASYFSDNYSETEWILNVVDDSIRNGPIIIKLVYVEKRPNVNSGPFSEEEEHLIESVLDIVSLKINRILDQKEIHHKQELLERSNDLAKIGHWEVDLIKSTSTWSSQVYDIHEVDEDFDTSVTSGISFYKEGKHRDKIQEVFERAVKYGVPYDEDLIIITGEGNEKWVRTIGKPEFRDGKCVRVYGSFQDIDELKRTNIELQKTERKLRDILEYSTNLFYRHDANHVLSYVSPQSEYFFGIPQEEALIDWRELLTDHPLNREGEEITQKAIQTGKTQPSYRLQLQRNDGEKLWVRVNEAPVVQNGETIAVVGSLTDITELVKSQEQEEILAKVASETENIVIITDLDQNIEWVNKAFTRETGYTFDEAIGENPRFLQGPDTDPDTKALIRNKISNNESLLVEILNYKKSGEPYWVQLQISPMFDERGEVVRYFSISENITERKDTVQRLKSKRRRLEESQRLGKIGDWDFDILTDEVTWSDMLFEIFERDPGLGAPDYEKNVSYYFEDQEFFKESVRKAVEEGIPYSYDIKVLTENQNVKFVHLEGIPSVNDKGEVVKLHGVVQDITEAKRVKIELEKERDRLIEAQKLGDIGDWEYNVETRKVYWSDQLYAILDRDPSEGPLAREELYNTYIVNSEELMSIVENAHKDKSNYQADIKIKTDTGQEKYIYIEGSPIVNKNGEVERVRGVVQNITDRKEKELKIKAQQNQLLAVIDNIEGMLYRYVLRPDGSDEMVYISSGIEELLGVTAEQAKESTEVLWRIIDKEDLERFTKSVEESAKTLEPWYEQWQIETPQGEKKWIRGTGRPAKLEDGTIQWDTLIIDITKQVQQERLNEMLVQEVHHRVKNNLAIITAFLEIQKMDLDEHQAERETLERAITRIYSISEVHKLLYEGSDLVNIDVKKYLEELIDLVTETMNFRNEFEIDLQFDSMLMNVNVLTPLGMLINELLTNTFKHAYGDNEKGKIEIKISRHDMSYHISYKDFGSGVESSQFEESESSGFNIIKILLSQLEADYKFINEGGFALEFTFQERTKGAHANMTI